MIEDTLIGKSFCYWTVISDEMEGGKNRNVLCRCKCGTERMVRASNLINDSSKSCGCRCGKMNKHDLTGQKFGRLTVVRESDEDSTSVKWLCKCECGNETEVFASNLVRGKTQSCGCMHLELLRKYNDFDLSGDYGVCKDDNGDVLFIFDKEDYDKIKIYKWRRATTGYARTTFKGRNLFAHRLIIGEIDDNLVVDHINRNRTDNRKCNLRICTTWENCQNRESPESGIVGVYYEKSEDRWRSIITKNGITRRKRFKTKEEAIAQRLAWEEELSDQNKPDSL